ncbi:MAG: radical SAM protein [Candidatus Schekmanbacteria bacterium]|nr:MAG: radical SAM protein [Candidatus Schekmanbacteria bacterium]
MFPQLKDRLLRKATIIAARNRRIRNFIEKKRISLDFPSNLFIEPTNRCNLRCKMCPQNDEDFMERGFMDFQTFRKVIDESVNYGKRTAIFFHKDGEPLLHEGLFEMIEYAVSKKAAYRTHLSTNAHLLSEDKIKRLILSGLDSVIVNIDANYEETYRAIKGRGGLSKVESNVKEMIKFRNSIGKINPAIRVKIIPVDENRNEIEDFKNKWKHIADEVVISKEFSWPGRKGKNGKKNEFLRYRYPCISLWLSMTINWDGTVSVCCIDYYHKGIIGNVKDDTIERIWKGKLLQEIRKKHINGNFSEIEVCRNCQGLWIRDTVGKNSEKWLIRKMKKAGLWNE